MSYNLYLEMFLYWNNLNENCFYTNKNLCTKSRINKALYIYLMTSRKQTVQSGGCVGRWQDAKVLVSWQ